MGSLSVPSANFTRNAPGASSAGSILTGVFP
jgi:hypothetical protein